MSTTGQRLDLHDILQGILGSDQVYFQPPSNVVMQYPCIVYRRDNAYTDFAGNKPYSTTTRYQVIYIDRNPDSGVPDKIAALPMSLFNRFYTADNLNHDVYTLYF